MPSLAMQVVYVCGGKGHRFQPRPVRPKSLLPVAGVSLFRRLVDRFAVFHTSKHAPVVIVDAEDEEMPRAVDARLPGARVVAQARADGVANALLLALPLLAETVLVTLGDLFLDGTLPPIDPRPTLVVWREAAAADIRDNFGVVTTRGIVSEVVEKPRECRGMQCGVGVYVLTHAAISRFPAAATHPRTGERGITEGLQAAIDAGGRFHTTVFTGYYKNVNSPADAAAIERYLARPVC